MGQKVHPHGFRVGVIKNWDSRWFFGNKKDVITSIVEDYNIRKVLKKELQKAGVAKIEIERDKSNVRLHIHCAKPGIVIGKGGAGIEALKKVCNKLVSGKNVIVNIVEIKNADTNATLVAGNVASQLERRISFRRAMKRAIASSTKVGAEGIKIQVSGRLGGAEIARTEHYHEGTIPLQTLRADIDYGFAQASTTYGIIGVKVWIYKGEILNKSKKSELPEKRMMEKKSVVKRPIKEIDKKGGSNDVVA